MPRPLGALATGMHDHDDEPMTVTATKEGGEKAERKREDEQPVERGPYRPYERKNLDDLLTFVCSACSCGRVLAAADPGGKPRTERHTTNSNASATASTATLPKSTMLSGPSKTHFMAPERPNCCSAPSPAFGPQILHPTLARCPPRAPTSVRLCGVLTSNWRNKVPWLFLVPPPR
ncbi:uncharacterized protein PAC_13379 [Phialocephala subalpina]|uniref:Uncharacterized protein n=1 Tax=Phialocephala subalpina TaxID=576137 RepID=A0A1L7XEM9_9HELO|nr:uncharacterized protein PAC_13379 [Phialocephala subalpina]